MCTLPCKTNFYDIMKSKLAHGLVTIPNNRGKFVKKYVEVFSILQEEKLY